MQKTRTLAQFIGSIGLFLLTGACVTSSSKPLQDQIGKRLYCEKSQRRFWGEIERVKAHLRAGEWRQAIQVTRLLSAFDRPCDAIALFYQARAYRAMRRYYYAIKALRQARADDPHNEKVVYDLACNYALAGSIDRAMQTLSDLSLLLNLDNGKAETLERYQNLLETDPDLGTVRSNAGFASLRKRFDRLADKKAEFVACIDEVETDPTAVCHTGFFGTCPTGFVSVLVPIDPEYECVVDTTWMQSCDDDI